MGAISTAGNVKKKKETLRSIDAIRALQYLADFQEVLPALSLNEEIFPF